MVEKKQRNKPVFNGLTWYRDQYYSFFVPLGWPHAKWNEGKEGVIFQPDPEDKDTLLAAKVEEFDISFAADDQKDLKEGFIEGIKELSDCNIEKEEDWVIGDTIGLEAKFTYTEEDQKRKRWIRVFYQKNRQTTIIAQGSSEDRFAYWTPTFYEAMMTTRIHERKPEIKEVTQ